MPTSGCKNLWGLGIFLIMGMALLGPALTHAATQFIPGSLTEADANTVVEVLAAFDQAEEAMKAKDLDKLMEFYANDYNYHGLTKSDVRKIWKDLFENYSDIGSSHMFSLIRMSKPSMVPTVEITCTGSLYATSKTTKLQVPIDSWYQEVHFLVKENGTWHIRGNMGEAPTVLPFGTDVLFR